MKAAHRNIKPCCKLPYYSRVLDNCICTIIFSLPISTYLQSLLSTVRLLLWITNFLSCAFIFNCTINHFEHFFSTISINTKTETLNVLLFVRLWGSKQFEGKCHSLLSNDSEISEVWLPFQYKYTPAQKLF